MSMGMRDRIPVVLAVAALLWLPARSRATARS
jgi:hypothetical protein